MGHRDGAGLHQSRPRLTGNLIWACLTNILLMTLYSANNTPYSAMSGVMTGDVNERTSLSSFRFVAAMIAQLIVGGFTLPLVAKFGQGNNAKGWQMTMSLWAVVCVVLFVITFLTTRERIQPDPKQKSDPKQDFGALLKNGPWIAMFILTLAHFAVLAMRGGTMFYYFQYYVNQDRLFDLLQSLGLTGEPWQLPAERLRPDRRCQTLQRRLGGLQPVEHLQPVRHRDRRACAPPCLSMRFGKKAVAIVGFSLTTVFMAAFVLLPADAIGTIFLMEYIRALTYAPTIPLIWAMFADVADYSEWKTGRRTTGRDLRDHSLRPEDRPESRRRHGRLAALRLRLSPQRSPDTRSATGHPHDHQRLPRDLFRHRDRLPDLLTRSARN